ncbi:hypothetical protein SAMN04489716_1612 [Actinoplanes derwentensis]|uniref:Uncharacterized protein n=1 Tax=Actinoplanes derwentensis TaxID=113562 RepID=A0A1H1V2Y9_9ACTN|nr:hypothetical protein SAMN04489716_1612 [Actinoplanes derwentensis]
MRCPEHRWKKHYRSISDADRVALLWGSYVYDCGTGTGYHITTNINFEENR